MSHIHAYHIGTSIIGIILVICLWMARSFVKEILSEKDAVTGECYGSHKRLIAFMATITACLCEIFHTLKQEKFDTQHLIIFFTAALLYSRVATVSQVMAIWKGKSTTVQTVATPDKTVSTAQTTTQTT